MKKLLLIAALATLLAGCGKDVVGGTGTVPIPAATGNSTVDSVVNVINQAPAAIAQACSIGVTLGQVGNVVGELGVPYVGMLDDVVASFCKAFDRAGASRSGGPTRAVVVATNRRSGKRVAVVVTGRRL